MKRRIAITLIAAAAAFCTAAAQNSIDELVDKYSVLGTSKYTSAVERDPKTHAVVRVVKVLEIKRWGDVKPFYNAFKREESTGNITERRDNEGLTVILTTQKGGRNRIYMLKASGERAGKKNLIYHNISTTIIIKYR